MFLTDEDQTGFRLLTIVKGAEERERIIHVPEPAQAGYAGDKTDLDFMGELPTYSLPDFKYQTETHRSFDVAGDSMEPTLFEGDKVVCSFIEPRRWDSLIKDNYVYVIVTRGDVLVKRLVNKIRIDRTLELHSDNDFYKPFAIPIGDIREIWYARVKISPFLPSPQKILEMTYSELKELRQTVQDQFGLIESMQKNINKLLSDKE
jgi:hypothetical protein